LTTIRNPHFDDDRVVWDDSYSGVYQPVPYEEQFDGQWRLHREGVTGYVNHTGVETDDEYIDDRIFELTGVKDVLLRRQYGDAAADVALRTGRTERVERRGVGGRLYLEPKFPIDYFVGKRCLDLGCGVGRWTKTLTALGGSVKATDVSESALQSVSRFTKDFERLNLFDILDRRADLHGAFDFTLCWGVIMCTHDPKLAFENVARTVAPGGSMYAMVYAPTYHVSDFVMSTRKHYHRVLKTADERADFVKELTKDDRENAINYHDMLNTFYNWTITDSTLESWFQRAGFNPPIFLNRNEVNKCGHHVLSTKR